MKCASAQDWLLQCDSLQPKTWPRKVVKHVKSCPSCYEFARSLKKLESSWRHQSLPATAKKPSPQFLTKVAQLEEPAAPARDWARPARWLLAAAASILIGIGIISYMVFTPGETRASDLVDNLIEWNAQIANAESAEKRKELLEESEDVFRKRLQNARVSKEDRVIGELILESARKLTINADLDKENEIITQLADKLLVLAKAAEVQGNKKDFERLGGEHAKFVSLTVNPVQNKLKIVGQLIEWTTAMAKAEPEERLKLLADNEASLQKEIQNARLPADERAMAEKLLDVGRKLANTPPNEAYGALSDVAENLYNRADTAKKNGNERQSERFGMGFSAFMQNAVHPYCEKYKIDPFKGPGDGKKGPPNFFNQKPWERNNPPFIRPDMQKKGDGFKKGFYGAPGPIGYGGYRPGFGSTSGPAFTKAGKKF